MVRLRAVQFARKTRRSRGTWKLYQGVEYSCILKSGGLLRFDRQLERIPRHRAVRRFGNSALLYSELSVTFLGK